MDFNSGKSSQKRPVAIILGVSRGIGKALAQALFATHDLILASKSIAEIQTLANQLQQQPTNHTHSASRKSALAVQCDVRSSKDIEVNSKEF